MEKEVWIPMRNIQAIGSAYAEAIGGHVDRTPSYTTVVAPGFFYPRNVIDNPEIKNLQSVIDSIKQRSMEGKTSTTTFTLELVPENTAQLFEENGFATHFIQKGMIREPGLPVDSEVDPHVRILSPEELPLWMDTMMEGFVAEGKPREDAVFAAFMKHPDFYFLGYEEDGVLKGAMMLHLLEAYSGIHEVAVPAKFRGHSISGKMLKRALQIIADHGNNGAALQASPLGRPVYEKAGFRVVSNIQTVYLK